MNIYDMLFSYYMLRATENKRRQCFERYPNDTMNKTITFDFLMPNTIYIRYKAFHVSNN